jgi:serine O-acetyltransferase
VKRWVFELRRRLQVALCCQIPRRYWRTVMFPHPVGIVIGDGATIGRNVRIYQNVTLGLTANGVGAYPTIEDGVSIYAGAVVIGGITVGAGAVIGANAFVSRDVPAGAVVVGFNGVREKR